MQPIIGIIESPYRDNNGNVFYEGSIEVAKKINECGGVPIGITNHYVARDLSTDTFCESSLTMLQKGEIEALISMCDGFIKPDSSCIYEYDKYIIHRILDRKMPFLGINTGMQIMGLYGKGEMKKVLNDTDIYHNFNEKDIYAHRVLIDKMSKLYSILKKDEIEVNSRHNYSVYHFSHNSNVKVSASSYDAVTEAIENPNHHFQIGVQWNPELLNDQNSDRLFDALVTEAKKQKVKSKRRY